MEPVEIRLMGEQARVTEAIEQIGRVLNVSYDGNLRPKRHGAGVRAYLVAEGNGSSTRSPLELAEAAKARRDLVGEIDTLMRADAELRRQRWYPIRPGDMVCWSIDMPRSGRHGETLVAVDDPDWPTEGGAPLRKVSETPYETIGASAEDHDSDGVDEDQADEIDNATERAAVGPRVVEYQDFYDIWFEVGPSRIAVIREGQLVYGQLVSAEGLVG